MHRTQVILEDWQYHTLRARAEQEGRSISDLVREILRQALSRPDGPARGLDGIDGIGEDAEAYGRDHDRHLYGDKGDD